MFFCNIDITDETFICNVYIVCVRTIRLNVRANRLITSVAVLMFVIVVFIVAWLKQGKNIGRDLLKLVSFIGDESVCFNYFF